MNASIKQFDKLSVRLITDLCVAPFPRIPLTGVAEQMLGGDLEDRVLVIIRFFRADPRIAWRSWIVGMGVPGDQKLKLINHHRL